MKEQCILHKHLRIVSLARLPGRRAPCGRPDGADSLAWAQSPAHCSLARSRSHNSHTAPALGRGAGTGVDPARSTVRISSWYAAGRQAVRAAAVLSVSLSLCLCLALSLSLSRLVCGARCESAGMSLPAALVARRRSPLSVRHRARPAPLLSLPLSGGAGPKRGCGRGGGRAARPPQPCRRSPLSTILRYLPRSSGRS